MSRFWAVCRRDYRTLGYKWVPELGRVSSRREWLLEGPCPNIVFTDRAAFVMHMLTVHNVQPLPNATADMQPRPWRPPARRKFSNYAHPDLIAAEGVDL